MGTALWGVLNGREERETVYAVYQLSTMVCTNLYHRSGDLRERQPALHDHMVFTVY